jgi:hypothetical protein
VLRSWTRSASSFGPAFAERSLTSGQSKVSIGVNWLHAGYSSFGNQNLSNGEFRPAQNIQGFTPVPQTSYTSATLDMSSDTLVMFSHIGVTDNLDVGLAVPFTTVRAEGTGGFYSATGALLVAPAPLAKTSASGVGDIAFFGKYRFIRQKEGGLAGAVEVRLPSGDTDNLRGLGVTRTLVSAIWSKGGRVSPHANVGYEFWSNSVLFQTNGSVFAKNQVKYAAGIEIEAQPRLTIVFDLVGQNILHGGQLGYETFRSSQNVNARADLLVALPESVHAVSVAPSVKWNVWRSVLVTGNVLLSVSNNGLRANVIPVFGLDWAF